MRDKDVSNFIYTLIKFMNRQKKNRVTLVNNYYFHSLSTFISFFNFPRNKSIQIHFQNKLYYKSKCITKRKKPKQH